MNKLEELKKLLSKKEQQEIDLLLTKKLINEKIIEILERKVDNGNKD